MAQAAVVRGEKADEVEIYTPKEAAKKLRVGEDAVRALVAAGELRAVNVGINPNYPRMRIRSDDLAAFIEKRTEQAS